MTKKTLSISAVLFLTILALPTYGKPLTIYVSIPPQQWLVEALAGELAATEVLLGKGQDPHTFEPTPRQIAGLSKADIYFTIGMTFERHISMKLAQTSSTLKIVDSSHGTHKLAGTDIGHTAQSAEEHSPENGFDQHVWLSPVNLIVIARNIKESMAEKDGANQDVYEQNFAILEQQLLQLHENLKTKLAHYAGAHFFVFHPAFGYFAHDYHLHQVPIESEGKAPSPKQLFKIVAQARSLNIRALFIQPQFDPNSANAVAQAINGEVIALDPLAKNIIANLEMMADAIADSFKNRNN